MSHELPDVFLAVEFRKLAILAIRSRTAAAACTVLNAIERSRSPESVARRVFGRDEPTQILLRTPWPRG